MIKVSLGPAALQDIARIADCLFGESPKAADVFARDVAHVLGRLSAFPDSGRQMKRSTVRFVMLPRLPYKLFYRRISQGELRVMRIRHGRRRPLRIET